MVCADYLCFLLQEDDAIVQLVKEYGTKKWTFVANKLEDKFKIRTRTGKQCRER